MKREALAVIHGRFQPLHNGHLEYLLAGKAMCDVLTVGITSPDPWHLGSESTAPERGKSSSNPFTFYERYLMVEAALVEAGVSRDGFRIVPFPHSFPERLCHYAPVDAMYLLSIYDQWGEAKLERFKALGLRTHVLWRRAKAVTSGTAIRALIRSGGDWGSHMPPAVAGVITRSGSDTRIRQTPVNGAHMEVGA